MPASSATVLMAGGVSVWWRPTGLSGWVTSARGRGPHSSSRRNDGRAMSPVAMKTRRTTRGFRLDRLAAHSFVKRQLEHPLDDPREDLHRRIGGIDVADDARRIVIEDRLGLLLVGGDAVLDDRPRLEEQFADMVRAGFDGVAPFVRCTRYDWYEPPARAALAWISNQCRQRGMACWSVPDPRLVSRRLAPD